MVILAVSSVAVTALSNPFSGIGSKIGGTLGKVGGGWGILVIVVNTVIIALLLYLLTTQFKFLKAEKKLGNIILVILVIAISLYLAINLSTGSEGKYQFIWSKPVVNEIMFYLFNGDPAKGPIGILRPSRILILVGASLLLYWLFTDVLNIGKGNKKIDAILAVIIAMEATHSGLTKGWLIFLGQFISCILLYRRFKGEKEGFDPKSLIWAYALVSAITNAVPVFREEGFFLFGLLKINTFRGLIWTIIIVVFGGLLITGIWGVARKKKKEAEEKKKEKRWKEGIVAYPLWYLLRWLGKVRNPLVRYLYKKLDPKITTPEGLIPFPFRDLRVEFMTLMNYMLRLEVYKAKKNYVTETQQFMDSEIYSEWGLHEVFKLEDIHRNLNVLKNGGGFKLNGNGFFEPNILEVENPETGKKEKLMAGFNSKEWFIYELVNNLKRELEEATSVEDMHPAVPIGNKLKEAMDAVDGYLEGVRGRWGCESMNDKTGRFTGMAMRKGAYNLLEGRRIFILDQYRHHGSYDHTYKFAKDKAKFYSISLSGLGVRPDDCTLKEFKDRLRKSSEVFAGAVDGEFKYEVDIDGFFVDDYNAFFVESKNGYNGVIRRVKPEDVVEHESFNKATKWLEAEWDFFVWDVRDGRYHQNSRSAKDYNDVHAKRSFDYSNLKPHSGIVGRENPAFDREALRNPAFDYIGRKGVEGVEEESVSKNNIKPGLSTLGMKRYLLSYLQTKMEVDERFVENVGRYVYDTGSETGDLDVFTRSSPVKAEGTKKE